MWHGWWIDQSLRKKGIVTFICVQLVTCQLSQEAHKCRPIACVFEFVYCTINQRILIFFSQQHSLSCSFCLFVPSTKSVSVRCFKSDWGEIWQDFSSTKYSSINRVRFLIWCHTFRMKTMTFPNARFCICGSVHRLPLSCRVHVTPLGCCVCHSSYYICTYWLITSLTGVCVYHNIGLQTFECCCVIFM